MVQGMRSQIAYMQERDEATVSIQQWWRRRAIKMCAVAPNPALV